MFEWARNGENVDSPGCMETLLAQQGCNFVGLWYDCLPAKHLETAIDESRATSRKSSDI